MFSDSIRKSLDQAGFKDVNCNSGSRQGHSNPWRTRRGRGKAQAESLATFNRRWAGCRESDCRDIPVGVESEAKAVNSDLDAGIEKNLRRRAHHQ